MIRIRSEFYRVLRAGVLYLGYHWITEVLQTNISWAAIFIELLKDLYDKFKNIFFIGENSDVLPLSYLVSF